MGVDAIGDGVEHDLHAQRLYLGQKLCADVHAAHARMVASGAEKLVDLLEQLPAGLAVFIHHQDLRPVSGRLDGGGQPGRARAYDQDLNFFVHAYPSHFPRPSWVSTIIPSSTGVTQVRTLGSPLTVITQLVQRPIPQKYPLGS